MEELPDEILVDILSRLPTKEALGPCSNVSRRWRNLGTQCRNLDLVFKSRHEGEYVRNCVGHVLSKLQHQQGEMDHLRIAFNDMFSGLDRSFLEWFEFANSKRVQSLTIDIKTFDVYGTNSDGVVPGHVLATALKSWDNWNRLTALSFKSVALADEDVVALLSKSPNLETLLLENVPVTKFKWSEIIPKLKRLEILNCMHLKDIVVKSAPNLESFKLANIWRRTNAIPVCFEHAPKLGDVWLGGILCVKRLRGFQESGIQLQKLHLDIDIECYEHWYGGHDSQWWERILTFGNLKELELRFSSHPGDDTNRRMDKRMERVIEFIQASPCLVKLTLKYKVLSSKDTVSYDGVDADDYAYDLNHGANECLEEVRVVGWSGLKPEVRFMRYLIHTSPKLRTPFLDPTPPQEPLRRGTITQLPKKELEFAARAAQKLIAYQQSKSYRLKVFL